MGIRFTPNIPPPTSPDLIVTSRLRRVNPPPRQIELFQQAELPFEEFLSLRGTLDAGAFDERGDVGFSRPADESRAAGLSADRAAAFEQFDLTQPGVLIDLIV